MGLSIQLTGERPRPLRRLFKSPRSSKSSFHTSAMEATGIAMGKRKAVFKKPPRVLSLCRKIPSSRERVKSAGIQIRENRRVFRAAS